MDQISKKIYPEINRLINSLKISDISEERKKILQDLIDYIQKKVEEKNEVNLNFICTHNSRRSHLSQVWAQAIAAYIKIPKVICYSGGTEATALYPMVARTLQDAGFKIEKLSETNNPVYSIKFGPNALPIVGFSKTYDHQFNPENNFAAIMTCSQADEGCPFIAGAEKRISINYNDPKEFDNTPQQAEKYKERSLQIATELFYVFSSINK